MIVDKYCPSEISFKFISFLRATGNENFPSPEIHYKMADKLFSPDKADKNVLEECCRGVGKSTVAEYAVIFAASLGEWPGFGPCPFIIFLGASAEGNVKQFFKNVANKITNSQFLSQIVTVKRVTDKEIELVNASGVELFIAGKGMNVNWRGARSPRGHRPSILLADDILHTDSATSETIRNTIETNWFASALPALAPKHKIIYIGTPISPEDLLHKLKNSGSYSVLRFPLCSKFPVTEAEYDSIWPELFTYEYTNDMYKQFKTAGTTQLFYQEYMLEPTDLGTLLVEEDVIQWFDPSLIYKNKDSYNFYITTDFATSTKKSADFSTIGVWAISNNSDWLLIDGQCKRQTMQTNMEDLLRYVKKWGPISVGIESSGQQGGFISILQEMMMKANVWFQFATKKGSKALGIRPTKDKVERFVTGVQPKFNQRKIWLPKPEIAKIKSPRLFELVEELTHELSRFTLAGGVKALNHDDCLTGDTLVTIGNGEQKRIDLIQVGEEVMTFDIDFLTQPVESVILKGSKVVMTYVFSNGEELSMTGNHPVLTTSGYIPAELLTSEDEIICSSSLITKSGLENQLDTTKAPQCLKMVNESGYTNTRGKRLMGYNLKDFMYTIRMKIKTITQSKIWNYFHLQNIQNIMVFKETSKNKKSILLKSDHWLMNGINQMKVGNGLKRISKKIEKKYLNSTTKVADGVEQPLKLDSLTGLPTATDNVNFKQYKQMIEERKSLFVSGAKVSSSGIGKKLVVPKNVAITYLLEKKDKRSVQTYNLEVKKVHNFIANGVVVHNCIDLLNQLSEIDIFVPSGEGGGSNTIIDEDGTMWEFDDSIAEDSGHIKRGSTVF